MDVRTDAEQIEALARRYDTIDVLISATLRALLDERDALQPVGWIFFNPDTGTELSDQHPIDSGECPDATRIWPATAPTLAEFLKEAWETNRTTEAERDAARAEVERLRKALNTPELHDFAAGVVSEAQHQRERWGASHDAGKAPEDWFWLLGYLGGKALHAAKAGDTKKALHHTISTAAALANWHAALLGAHSAMRPGIGEGSAVYPAALAALAAKEGGQ